MQGKLKKEVKVKKSTIANIIVVVWGIAIILIGAKDIVLTLYYCFPGWVVVCGVAYYLCRKEEKEEEAKEVASK